MLRDAHRPTAQPQPSSLDRLARLAARVLHAPIALTALGDADRFIIYPYTEPPELCEAVERAPLVHALCRDTLASTAPVLVDNTSTSSPQYTEASIAGASIGAFAGVPLLAADGAAQGVFGVADRAARQWTVEEQETLHQIAQLAADALVQRDVEEFRVLEAQLALVNRQLPLVFWTTDAELRLTSVSGAGLPDMPSDPTGFLGQPVHVYFATTGASSELVASSLAAHQRALAGERFWNERNFRGQADVVQVEPLRDAAGRIVGCLGMLLPLTTPLRVQLELQNSRDRLQTLSTQLLHAQETERRAIARELHDQVGQELTLIQMSLQDLLETEMAQLPDAIADTSAMVERVLAQVRDMALDLRPSQLDDLGLAEALHWYLERHAAHGHLQLICDLPTLAPRPSAEVETACFRITQEAMTNILRSARAAHVWVSLAREGGELVLTVRDDGRGFDVAAAREQAMQSVSLGLLGMEERARLVGGRVAIESTVGQGATVRAWLPLGAPANMEDA